MGLILARRYVISPSNNLMGYLQLYDDSHFDSHLLGIDIIIKCRFFDLTNRISF